VRAASNPGGPGHEWVKQRFIVEGRSADRPFIRSRLLDNPHLATAEYESSLAALDPITREQLLNGDWTVRAPGATFRREWFPVVDDVPRDLHLVRSWDLAATAACPGRDADWTVGALVGRDPDGVHFVLDVQRTRATPGSVERLVHQTAQLDGRSVEVIIEQEPGASGVALADHYRARVLSGFAVRMEKPTGSKVTRAMPLASAAEAGIVRLLRRPWVSPLLDELDAFPEGSHDDQVDALAAAFTRVNSPPPRLRILG
jgi:predicted phage terminase large subunit-like protein